MLQRYRDTINRCLADRKSFRTNRAWLVSLYDRLLRRYPRIFLPFRGTKYGYAVVNAPQPLTARLGTSDALVMSEVFFQGAYDGLLELLSGDVECIVDLGANCGFSLILWLKHYRNARILAVEPDPSNMELLKANNANAMRTGQLQTLQACIGGVERISFLDKSQDAWAYSVTDLQSTTTQPIQIRSLESVLKEFNILGDIDLLKCDIEGSERELMATCGTWIGRVKNLVIELHPPYSLDDLKQELSKTVVEFKINQAKSKGSNEVYLLQQLLSKA